MKSDSLRQTTTTTTTHTRTLTQELQSTCVSPPLPVSRADPAEGTHKGGGGGGGGRGGGAGGGGAVSFVLVFFVLSCCCCLTQGIRFRVSDSLIPAGWHAARWKCVCACVCVCVCACVCATKMRGWDHLNEFIVMCTGGQPVSVCVCVCVRVCVPPKCEGGTILTNLL